MTLDLEFLRPFKSKNITTFTFAESRGQTVVNWKMVGPKTLMSRIFGLFMNMDKMIGRDFEKGLAQLNTAATETR